MWSPNELEKHRQREVHNESYKFLFLLRGKCYDLPQVLKNQFLQHGLADIVGGAAFLNTPFPVASANIPGVFARSVASG